MPETSLETGQPNNTMKNALVTPSSTSPPKIIDSDIEYAYLCTQEGDPQQALARYTALLLNYQYGLSILIKQITGKIAPPEPEYRRVTRCVFVINDQIPSPADLTLLQGETPVPLVLLCPEATLAASNLGDNGSVFVCSWGNAFQPQAPVLPTVVAKAFAAHQISRLFESNHDDSAALDSQRIGRLLKNVETLPTLPQIVLHIMRLVHDPNSTAEALEKVVLSDPAVVHKLLQVINSPIFAGPGHKGQWNLKEAIVRLGRRKVATVVQQIKLINTFVKSQESAFDMRRFWQHSVGCAVIADRIYEHNLVSLRAPISFNEYWIGALLHDVGKLLLGSFFWGYFSKVAEQLQPHGTVLDFRQAETNLGNVADHEFIGRLLLMKAKLQRSVIEAVGTHHTGGASPRPLVCLVHLADNLSKDLGMGYFSASQGNYSPAVLRRLRLHESDLDQLRQQLGESVQQEVRELVDRCLEPSTTPR
jgi:HD-like signal output (HDOD) protein